MGNNKNFYWLKLKEDFFDDKIVKLLRRLPDGDKLAIIYLEILLKTLKTNGKIFLDGLFPDQAEEIALWIDEDIMAVKLTLDALKKYSVVEIIDNDTLYINTLQYMIGKETDSAERMRKMREREKQNLLPSHCDAYVTISDTEIEKREKRKEIELYVYGKFKNIKLTQTQFEELIETYNATKLNKRIDELSEYLELNNKTYKNHYLLIQISFRDNWFSKKQKQTFDQTIYDFNEIELEQEEYINKKLDSIKNK